MAIKIGTKVIVRGVSSGVQYGTLVSLTGTNVELEDSRRLWYWSGAFTLPAVAEKGIDTKNSKVAVNVTSQVILDACEVLAVSKTAQMILDKAPEYKP